MEIISSLKENTISIFIPMTIKKRGCTAMIIVPKNIESDDRPYYDKKLIKAFAKAYKWQQSLCKNSKLSINSIAESESLTPAYVGRILRLNFLAPDIIKAILDGKQPRDLRLQDFMNNNIPDLWEEQRNLCGIILSDQKL